MALEFSISQVQVYGFLSCMILSQPDYKRRFPFLSELCGSKYIAENQAQALLK
uniref:Uncharacterized protein n=1 Tax=Solanum tuberosum TaxID=4113 RepID=M1CP97_SOLTU